MTSDFGTDGTFMAMQIPCESETARWRRSIHVKITNWLERNK